MTRKRASRDMFDDEAGGGFLAGVGELIAAHPSIAGGSAAFAVIFGFVSANALWYQPGKHPAPILSTRGISEPPAATGVPVSHESDAIREAIEAMPVRRVTTYRIERGDDTSTASIPVPNLEPNVETIIGDDAQARRAEPPAADPLLAEIQAQLKHKGFYGGEVDGLMGPMSGNAIRNWQKRAGLDQTGTPSQEVLESLKRGGRLDPIAPRGDNEIAAAPVPAKKPATRTATTGVTPTPPVTVPAPAPATAAGGSDLVKRIQTGLSNIAYADIAVDGMLGEQTKAAIRAFETHYRLPVTGEPNPRVLTKLEEIGAL